MTVYFDNAATTKVCQSAAEAAAFAMTECYGNPSSGHAAGRAAKTLLDTARKNVASAMGAMPEEIYFTSGGTEADNWAILGGAFALRHRGKHIITSAAEHDAVRGPMKKLAEDGFDVTFLKPGKDGRIDPAEFEKSLREDTVFASLMLVNNETGAINPIEELSRILKKRRPQAWLHVDGVQAFCKIPFSVKTLGADMVSVSSHKIHGPKGAGALYVKKGLNLKAMLRGGGQERGLRPGTEAMPNISGFGAAAALGKKLLPETERHLRALRNDLKQRIEATVPEAVFIGAGDAPHILSISLPGYKSEVVMNCLDAEGICVSKSSACKKGARSHVLEAMGLENPVIDGAIRISFSRYNTLEETAFFADKLQEAAARLRTVPR